MVFLLPGFVDFGWTEKYNGSAVMTNLKEKLFRTRKTVKNRIDELLSSKKNREEILDDLMEILILADIGVSTVERIIEHLRENSKKTDSQQGIRSLLRHEIGSILSQHPVTVALKQPQSVAMCVGINGGGKTTSLAALLNDCWPGISCSTAKPT